MNAQQELLAFNRGVVSRYSLARLDIKRLAMAAEEQTNWVPKSLGPMSLRPGLKFVGEHIGESRMLPFIFSIDDTAGLEMSAGAMRVWVGDALLTRAAVAATITNGSFTTDLAGWTDDDEVGATSAWYTGGYLSLTGDGTAAAIRTQAVAVTAGSAHALRIVVTTGPVTLRVGSTSGATDIRADTSLEVGTHSIVVTPTGATMHVQFRSTVQRQILVASVAIEGAGIVALPLPYALADLPNIRYRQSGDVVFIACRGYRQRRIERRSGGSWSVVEYLPEDGPFRVENVGPITITPSGLTGNISLAASDALWDSTHQGALWSITSAGQKVEASASADNVETSDVRVFGIGESRRIGIIITGTFSATVTLQRSVGEVGSWEDVKTYTVATTTTYNDALDNQIIYYRLAVKGGDYTSGTAAMTITYSAGARRGVVRITGVVSPTSVSAEVLSALGGTDATDIWAEGQWSDFRGWPSSADLHDGRLWWAGKDKFLGSVTDAFSTFDPEYEGDAGPVSRSIGFGPVDNINWLLSLSRLLAGTDMAELSCRSSSFDEPLTPTNFTVKKVGTQGTANIAAIEVDNKGIFVSRDRQHVYELSYSIETQDYNELDLTQLCPEFLAPGVRAMAVQRKPDTRVHCCLDDGTVGVLVFDKAENLICWVRVETAGQVEDVMVLPGTPEDAVYYSVKRTVGGSEVRYLERWALDTECRGGSANLQADSFVYSAHEASTISGLGHLEGEDVVVWAEGQDRGTFTVTGGEVDLGEPLSDRCAGLGYRARFRSTKLAYTVPPGKSALGAKKRINGLGLVVADTHAQGLLYGPDFDNLDSLPMVEDGFELTGDEVHANLEMEAFTFPGVWTTDMRLCLEAQAPRPATVLAAIVDMNANPK